MYHNTTSIKSWAEDDRPREKMQSKGKTTLSNSELLAIIIGSGTKKKSAVNLAQEILNSVDNNLYLLGKLNQSDLMQFHGVGTAKAITILAALELARRRTTIPSPNQEKLNTPEKVYNYIKPYFMDLSHEEFRVLGMSASNKVIRNKLISKGGITGTIADGKIIFKELLDMKANSCILVHNHPSGNLQPSTADIKLTQELSKFGKYINLSVLDHLIVSDDGFYSFSLNGNL